LESQAEWEGFLNDLYQRGLKAGNLKLIVTDGGKGLRAALPLVFGHIPVQLCWAHKTRNVLDKVRRFDQVAVKKDLHRISHAPNLAVAHRAAQRFIARWQKPYPQATLCLSRDLSREGLKINSQNDMKVGSTLDLEITIPDDPKPVHTSGKVMWSRISEEDNQGFEQGVRFMMMDPVDKFRVLDYAYNHWLETKVNDFADPEEIPGAE